VVAERSSSIAPNHAHDSRKANPNEFPVNIAHHVLTATPAVDKPLCEFADNFVLTSTTDHPEAVPANGEVSFNGGSIRLVELLDVDQVHCQRAVVTFSYTLAPQ
jgi:hypothetical protein